MLTLPLKINGRNGTFKDVNVRRQRISDALMWLITNNPHYSDVQIDYEALNALPDDAVPYDLLTVETDEAIVSDKMNLI